MKNENSLQLAAMFQNKSPEVSAAFKELDSVHNLNSDPMALRCAGFKAARASFASGYKLAAAELVPTIEKLLAAHSAWQCESEYLSHLKDSQDSPAKQHELTLLASISAAADQLSALVKTEPEPSNDD